MAVAHLVERLLPATEVSSSNPFIVCLMSSMCFEAKKRRKEERREWSVLKKINVLAVCTPIK